MKELLTVLCGDALEKLRELSNESAQCCVTSPPYWGLRDYGDANQIGLEKTPEEYVAKIVEVFREVRRILRSDGTLWLNLGDSYAGSWGNYVAEGSTSAKALDKRRKDRYGILKPPMADRSGKSGLKPKDLVGIPWMVAFALRVDGWWLRQDIIWAKPNPMPESVTDRCTKSHEYVFLLTKSARYFYDAEAIFERGADSSLIRLNQDIDSQIGSFRANGGAKTNGSMKAVAQHKQQSLGRDLKRSSLGSNDEPMLRNKRSVWTVTTQPYTEAHFATFPPDLIKPCILAGTMPRIGRSGYPTGKDVVLDPFAGSGTTGQVALELGRKAILIELNPKYVELIHQRCNVTPGLPLQAA